eukprot:5653669-Prymnesium_polylepis.1
MVGLTPRLRHASATAVDHVRRHPAWERRWGGPIALAPTARAAIHILANSQWLLRARDPQGGGARQRLAAHRFLALR